MNNIGARQSAHSPAMVAGAFACVAALLSAVESTAILVGYEYFLTPLPPPLFVLAFAFAHAAIGGVLGALAGAVARRAPAIGGRLLIVVVAWAACLMWWFPHWYAVSHSHPFKSTSLLLLAMMTVLGVGVGLAALVVARMLSVFRKRVPATIGAMIGVVVMGSLLVQNPSAEPPPTKPALAASLKLAPETIIILTFDALRADHMSLYGYGRDTSAPLDAFFSNAALFTQALAPKSKTGPSLASLLTGVYPPRHGAMRHGWVLNEGIPTLGNLVPDTYRTAAFVANPAVRELVGQGGFGHSEVFNTSPATEIVEAAERWLEAQAGKPVILWVHLFEPHSPYEPPASDWEPYKGDALYDVGKSIPYDLEGAAANLKVNRAEVGDAAVAAEVNDQVARYDGSIRFATRAAAGFLKGVTESRGDPFVLMSADHGESMVEHDFFFWHGPYCYQQVVHIPFAIRYEPLRLGGVHEMPVSLVDILPTVCGLVGCKPHAPFDGLDVVAALNATTVPVRPLFTSALDNPLYSSWGVVDGNWKLIATPNRLSFLTDAMASMRANVLGSLFPDAPSMNPYRLRTYKYELFDLSADPGELTNLTKKNAPRRRALAGRLQAWLDFQYDNIGGLVAEAGHKSISPETYEQLRALGYVE